MRLSPALVLGALLALGLGFGGWFVGHGFVEARSLERTVTVKGLAEREVPADTAIWPLEVMVAGDELEPLLERLETQAAQVRTFLAERGFGADEVSTSAPDITDRHAEAHARSNARLRYSATEVITVFTSRVDAVRDAGGELLELGKAGIVFSQDDYQHRTEYLFTALNDVKPEMIEAATHRAREVARKFADDSDSTLGKIRTARQGQFSISDRDSNNPHIKKVRVVSTLEYYLVD
ncbi:MAG: SIMPL domain-containing protein [Pseudomonadota bacterium]